jgi:hypothetical protein
MSGGILVGGGEGLLEHSAGHDVLKTGPYERRALAGLNVLEIGNAPNLTVYFNGDAFAKIAC